MKMKKVLFRTTGAALLICMLCFTSCEALATMMGCYYCTNSIGDNTSTCDDDEADQLRNSGWDCTGGW